MRRRSTDAVRRGATAPGARVEGSAVPSRTTCGQGRRDGAPRVDADARSEREPHARGQRAARVPSPEHAMPTRPARRRPGRDGINRRMRTIQRLVRRERRRLRQSLRRG